MTIENFEFFNALRPGDKWTWRGDDYSGLEWLDSTSKPTSKQISDKRTELENAEPMRVLRMQRNAKLAESDWTNLPDSPLASDKKSEWASYRQSLRTLPSTAEPRLDGSGNLTNVTWPTQPS